MPTLFDEASLVMIPSGVKDGKLYSIKPTDGTGDFTFTRGTDTATRVNSAGIIEKARENLYTQSNNFSHSDWSPKAGVFTKGVSDPNGGNEAWSWTAQNTDPFLYQAKNFTGVHCLSIYVKGVGSTIGEDFQVRVGTDLKDITLTGDWQRVQHFGVLSGSVNIGFEYGNPATANDVVHIYAAQLEQGLVATDYIDTTTAAVYTGITDNLPRLDYSGGASCPSLLLEPQRTNVLSHSEYFGGWGQINTINTANALISPEGVQNANKLIAASGVNNNVINQQISAGTYTASLFAKKGEFEGLVIATGTVGAFFNLNTYAYRTQYQSAATSHKIEDYGNGWHRYSITFTISGNDSLYIGPNDNVSNTLGVTGNNSNGIYIYGAQLEAGSYATSYIPTMGVSATRGADSCNSSSLTTSTDFTIFFEAPDFCLINGSTGGAYDNVQFVFSENGSPYVTNGSYHIYNNTLYYYNGSNSSGYGPIYNNQTDSKFVLMKRGNKVLIFANGAKKTEATLQSGGDASIWDTINLTQSLEDGHKDVFGSNYKQLLKFDTALTDQEAIDLTTL